MEFITIYFRCLNFFWERWHVNMYDSVKIVMWSKSFGVLSIIGILSKFGILSTIVFCLQLVFCLHLVLCLRLVFCLQMEFGLPILHAAPILFPSRSQYPPPPKKKCRNPTFMGVLSKALFISYAVVRLTFHWRGWGQSKKSPSVTQYTIYLKYTKPTGNTHIKQCDHW